jgi:hypothetical protein
LCFILLLMLGASAEAQSALPSDASTPSPELPSRKYLFGDWGGERSALEEKGVTFDFFYITDLQANPSGGLQQTRAGWERFRGTVDINFDKMISWQGLSFHATGLWQSGANLGGKIGTLANPSDLVSQHTTRLDSFWVQRTHQSPRVTRGFWLRRSCSACGGFVVEGRDMDVSEQAAERFLIKDGPIGFALTQSVLFLYISDWVIDDLNALMPAS